MAARRTAHIALEGTVFRLSMDAWIRFLNDAANGR